MRIPDGVPYEYAAILDPICNAYKAVAQESGLTPGRKRNCFWPRSNRAFSDAVLPYHGRKGCHNGLAFLLIKRFGLM